MGGGFSPPIVVSVPFRARASVRDHPGLPSADLSDPPAILGVWGIESTDLWGGIL